MSEERAHSRWIASTPTLIVAEAPSGLIRFCNGEASAVGRHLLDVAGDLELLRADGTPYAPSEWPPVRSLASGEVIAAEEVLVDAADGRRRTLRWSSTPVCDGSGRMVAAVAVLCDITTLGQRELAYLDSLLTNIDDAVVGTDADFRVTVWNQGAERLYGFRADEVLGRPARDVAGYVGDRSRLDLERELPETDRTRSQITARRKDGTPVEVELVSVAVRDEHEAITGYLGIHRDVTLGKRAEEDLRSAHARTERILETIGGGFFTVDGDWRYVYINDKAVDGIAGALGRPLQREELLGHICWDVFPDLVGTAWECGLRRAVRDNCSVTFEIACGVDGQWLDVRAYPSSDGLSVYVRDITERRTAETERDLRVAQQALVAQLGQRALATDDVQAVMDEAVKAVAQAFVPSRVAIMEVMTFGDELRMRAGTGWSAGVVGTATSPLAPTSLMGHTLVEDQPVVSDDVASDPRFELAPFLRAHGAVSAATVVIAGRERPFGVLAAFTTEPHPVSVDDINFLRAVANIVSTAIDRATSQDTLVQVREVERARLARALHDEALQQLAVALAVITAPPAGVPGADAAARLERVLPAMRRANRQLRAAIDDLGIGVGVGADADQPFSRLLCQLVAAERATAPDCTIVLDVRPGVPRRPLGPAAVEILRIAREALINARRHAGVRTIRVSAWGSDHLLYLEVADDGHGFDPTSHTVTGTGIRGMRERAALVHGQLEIRSVPRTGTVVRLSVALVDGRIAAERPTRILLVDDHVAVRQAIAGMFEREAGFDIAGQASTLAEARSMLAEVDVVVVEFGLPDGSGGDVIRELRDVNPHAQALVLTASLDRRQIAEAIESGAAGTLSTSVSLDEVIAAVRRLRAGEALLPLEEVVELMRFAVRQRELEHEDRMAIKRLTAREREVLQALTDGFDAQGVADRLHITVRTERNHVASILMKLGVHSQLQAVLLAARYGVVSVG